MNSRIDSPPIAMGVWRELAMAEDCPEADHLPGHRDRVAEVIDLNQKLNALDVLEALRVAVRHTD
jgi:hypothetical protein